jgi:cell division septum initiation protein DivIVA
MNTQRTTELIQELNELVNKSHELESENEELKQELNRYKKSVNRVWTNDGRGTIAKAAVEIETSDPTLNSSRFLGNLSKHRFVTNSKLIKVKFRNSLDSGHVMIVDIENNAVYTNMDKVTIKYDSSLTQETPIR